jgi:hypothetical protein
MLTQLVREKAQQTVERAQHLFSESGAGSAAVRTREFVSRTITQLRGRMGWRNVTALEKSQRGVDTQASAPVTRKTPHVSLEDLSRAELYALACELDVRGRKNLRKQDLILRIREAQAV